MSKAYSKESKNSSKENKKSSGGEVSQLVANTKLMQKKAKNQQEIFGKNITQKKDNGGGLPNNLKAGIENLSGLDMSDVKVHYNSSKPAQLNAFAFAQGNDIHLGSGQEKHLPHEAWHVVQQKQGRVKATTQMKNKTPINDDIALEKEADIMGAKALQMKFSDKPLVQKKGIGVVQRNKDLEKESEDSYEDTIERVEEESYETFLSKRILSSYDKFNLVSQNYNEDLSLVEQKKLLIKLHQETREVSSIFRDQVYGSKLEKRFNKIYEGMIEIESGYQSIYNSSEDKITSNLIYVEANKDNVIIRNGNYDKSKKVSGKSKKIKKGNIFLVEQVDTKLKTRRLPRKKLSEYYLIKAPVEYNGLWIKATQVTKTFKKGNKKSSDDSNILAEEILDGNIKEKSQLEDKFKDYKIPLAKQLAMIQFYDDYREGISQKVGEIIIKINNNEYYNFNHAINDLPKGHNDYDEEMIEKSFIKKNGYKEAVANDKYMDEYKKISFIKDTKDKRKEFFGSHEKGDSSSSGLSGLLNKLPLEEIKGFFSKIKDILSNISIETISDVIKNLLESSVVQVLSKFLGLGKLLFNIYSTWDTRKTYNRFKAEFEKNGGFKKSLKYALAKIHRAFLTKIMKLFKSLIDFTATVIGYLSVGTLAVFTESLKAFNSVISFTHTAFRRIKGAYKAFTGKRGKNRKKHATIIVNKAFKNNKDAKEFIIDIAPRLRLNLLSTASQGYIQGSLTEEFFNQTLSKYKNSKNEDEVKLLIDVKRNLIEQLATAMKSQ